MHFHIFCKQHQKLIKVCRFAGSCQCMDRHLTPEIGTKNQHTHPRAKHSYPLTQPRFRGNARLPYFVQAVSEIDQCLKIFWQVFLYRLTSGTISFSIRQRTIHIRWRNLVSEAMRAHILSKQYRKSINAWRLFGRCHCIDRHLPQYHSSIREPTIHIRRRNLVSEAMRCFHILSKQYRKSINAWRLSGRCHCIDRHLA
jgi:hypothetical protein